MKDSNIMKSNTGLQPVMSGIAKTLHGAFASLAALALIGTAEAVDNTGTGGTILYTDSTGANPVASPPYLGGFVVHKFTASGTLNVPVPVTANVLVVAGGGGGGGNGGGGGGAGGLTYNSAYVINSSISVTVGAGGAVHPNDATNPTRGGDSVFGIITTVGGGGGSSRDNGGQGATGGSGGGGAGTSSPRYLGGIATPAGQGNNGGNGSPLPDLGVNATGGGGGGAGGAGAAGANQASGSGGAGVQYPIFANIAGSPTGWFAGGGGGGKVVNGTNGTGGSGGGGAGGGVAGTANTGGGGGGGGSGGAGPSVGGSGIVLVRYPYDPGSLSILVNTPANSQTYVVGTSITAAAVVSSGTSPYSATFYLQTNGGGFTQVGSPDNTSPYEASLGALAVGMYNIKATVTDSASGMATSATNTFTVIPPDTTAPLITGLSPADNALRVSPLVDFVATFDEAIAVGTGKILIKNLTNGSQLSIAVTDTSQVSIISGNQLKINPTALLAGGRNYAIRIPAGAIRDQASPPNSFAGINDDTTWNFTTAPFNINHFANSSDAATGINSATNYTHRVDINNNGATTINGVVFNNTGAYTLTGAALAFADSNGYTGSGIAELTDDFLFNGNPGVLTVSGLTPGVAYKLRLYINGWGGGLQDFSFDDTSPATVVTSVDRGTSDGNPASLDYTFTLSPGDTDLQVTVTPQNPGNTFHFMGFSNEVVPATLDIASLSPADNTLVVKANANLVANFNKDLGVVGSGNIIIKNLTDSTTVATIAANDVSQVSISGTSLTINPTADLPIGKEIAVRMEADTVRDLAGNPFAGINDDTTWNFTTVAPFDDSTWIADAAGNWSDTTKWSSSLVSNGVNATATLGDFITAARTITVDGARTVGNITATDLTHDYTLSGSTLTLDRTSGTPIIDVVSGRTFTINNAIAGNDGLLKTGGGTLVLIGPSTYTGGTKLSAGALQFLLPASAGSGPIILTGNASISSGYYNLSSPIPTCSIVNALDIGSNTCTVTNPSTAYWLGIDGVVSGSGTLIAGPSRINCNTTLANNANTFTGKITLNNNHTLYFNSMGDGSSVELDNATVSIQSAAVNPVTFNTRFINLNGTGQGTLRNDSAGALIITPALVAAAGNKTLTLRGTSTANNTFGGAIPNGTGTAVISVTKSDGGKWILTGANEYTGATTISGGTLLVDSPGSLNASSAVAVNIGTLGGTGTINGSVTVAAAGSLAPGASAGTLAVGGLDISAMADNGTGKLQFELDALAGTNDKIAVTGTLTIGSGVLGFSDFVFSDLGGLQIGTYKLITSGAPINGTLDPIVANRKGNIGSLTGTLRITGNDLELVVTPAGPTGPYGDWATGGELFGADANSDGITNGLAWLLGAVNPSVNALNKMPIPTVAGGFLTLNFQRAYPYAPAKLYVQFGNALTGWTELLIPDGNDPNLGGTGVEVVVVFGTSPNPDQITVKIPTSYQSTSGSLFARLRAAEN